MNLMLGAMMVGATLSGQPGWGVIQVGWEAAGRAEADRDFAAGTPRYWRISCYLSDDKSRLFAEILGDRYGVSVVRGSETPRYGGGPWAYSYNARIEEYLDDRFGPDALRRAWQDADPARVFWWRAKVVLLAAGAAAVGLGVLSWWRVGRR